MFLENLFKSKAERELDGIISELKQYLENNYKDQAHLMVAKLHTRAVELHDGGKLKDEKFVHYEKIFNKYTEELKHYNHREFYKS